MTGTSDDDYRDAAALLVAVADRDQDGYRAILDNCNTREVAKLLAIAVVAAGRIMPGLVDTFVDEMRTNQEGTPP